MTLHNSLTAQTGRIDSLLSRLKTLPDDTNKLFVYSELASSSDNKESAAYNESYKRLASKLMLDKNATIRRFATNSLAFGYSNDGVSFYYLGKSEEALRSFGEALKLYNETGDKIEAASQLNSMASVYKKKGKLALAMINYMKCLELIESTSDKIGISFVLNNIAVLYNEVNEPKKALEYLERSLKLKKETNYLKGLSTVYNNIANVYMHLGDTNKCLFYYNLARTDGEKYNDKKSLANSLRFLGLLDLRKKNYESALENFEKSLAIYFSINDRDGISWLYCELSNYYTVHHNYDKAETYALKALAISKEIGYPMNIQTSAKNLKEIYKRTSRPAKALEMFEIMVQMQDSLATEITRKIVARQEIAHEFEIREAEAKLEQEKKDAIAIEETKKQRIITGSICVVLILVLAFAVFAYRSFLRKKKDHIEIIKQKELIEDKQKEILDSIHYAQRIQKALITSEKYIDKNLDKLIK